MAEGVLQTGAGGVLASSGVSGILGGVGGGGSMIESWEHNDLSTHYNGDTSDELSIVHETSFGFSATDGTLMGEVAESLQNGTVLSVNSEFDNVLGPDGTAEVDLRRESTPGNGPFLFLVGATSDDTGSFTATGLQFWEDGAELRVGPTGNNSSSGYLETDEDSVSSHSISSGTWYTFTINRKESAGEIDFTFTDDNDDTFTLTATTNTSGSGHGVSWDVSGQWYIDRFASV